MLAATRHRHAAHQGFTLIELMIVIAVAVAIAGVSIPVYVSYRERAKQQVTTVLVQAVAAAIDSYQVQTWTWADTTGARTTRPLWDLNNDGLLDGVPSSENAAGASPAFTSTIIDSGYMGCLDMARPIVGERFVSPQRRLIDAWGQALHVHYQAKSYGGGNYGVWSLGPDGADGTEDDIRSWEGH
ncbi:MAG: prepilin-type N-terminal cleavage/methylation domain-containing protein [Planctomycetota bacterium]|jgi:prepilin-type N-terminal cleavage/methylation domain-containing protein|nr:prepilin-type N-terminal cleavage/methylation domain-containing protein [Planctomycetota bacterium]